MRKTPGLSLGLITLATLLASTGLQIDKVCAEEGTSTHYFKGYSFKNANKIEFKYKERLKDYKEQLEKGKKKGWLTSQEAIEFQEKLDVLARMEKEVSAKKYPKKELDNIEKKFTLYNQEFYKASNTPVEKKLKAEKKETKNASTKSKEAKKKSSEPKSSMKKEVKK